MSCEQSGMTRPAHSHQCIVCTHKNNRLHNFIPCPYLDTFRFIVSEMCKSSADNSRGLNNEFVRINKRVHKIFDHPLTSNAVLKKKFSFVDVTNTINPIEGRHFDKEEGTR